MIVTSLQRVPKQYEYGSDRLQFVYTDEMDPVAAIHRRQDGKTLHTPAVVVSPGGVLLVESPETR